MRVCTNASATAVVMGFPAAIVPASDTKHESKSKGTWAKLLFTRKTARWGSLDVEKSMVR
jgi:hypothetical protein